VQWTLVREGDSRHARSDVNYSPFYRIQFISEGITVL
jgi:hypothetical protein